MEEQVTEHEAVKVASILEPRSVNAATAENTVAP